MTLEEQRVKLELVIARVLAGNVSVAQWNAHPEEHWRLDEARTLIASISAAGFSIVGPEVTEVMLDKGGDVPCIEASELRYMNLVGIFLAMRAAGDITRKAE